MKVHIWTDFEAVAGIADWVQIVAVRHGYPPGSRQSLAKLNNTTEGARS